jgi:bifunctional DNA-binding transcriptional regulator/antitoxin component of YhaV-PrlF toxin-antitoxin module
MPIEKEYTLRRARSGADVAEVTIPTEWRRYNRLEIGDKVKLLADGLIVIFPPENKELEEKARQILENI